MTSPMFEHSYCSARRALRRCREPSSTSTANRSPWEEAVEIIETAVGG
jgi:hypothetical protein